MSQHSNSTNVSRGMVILLMQGQATFEVATYTYKALKEPCDKHSKLRWNSYKQKAFTLLLSKMLQELVQKLKKTNTKIILDFILSLLFFLFSSFIFLMHSSVTKQRTQTLYRPNECYASVDVPFWLTSYGPKYAPQRPFYHLFGAYSWNHSHYVPTVFFFFERT